MLPIEKETETTETTSHAGGITISVIMNRDDLVCIRTRIWPVDQNG